MGVRPPAQAQEAALQARANSQKGGRKGERAVSLSARATESSRVEGESPPENGDEQGSATTGVPIRGGGCALAASLRRSIRLVALCLRRPGAICFALRIWWPSLLPPPRLRLLNSVRSWFCEVGRATAQGPGATPLSKHASFFDRNGDGVVSFEETYGGELLRPPPPLHPFIFRPRSWFA